MKKAGLLYVALLSLVGALATRLERRRRRGEADQGGVDLRRPAQRRRLVTGARRRSAVRPEDAGQEGHHDLQGERPRGPAGPAGDRRARARRQQDHLRDVVRLHGRDGRRGEEVPGRVFRARHRLQDREEHGHLLRRRRGRDLPRRHGAGAATKNGKVGFIVPFAIPEIIRHTNAFALGVLGDRPDATIRLVWTKSWFDPAKERKAAESLVAAGVDVIGQNVDSPSAGQYAQSKGIPWVGHGSDAKRFAPNSWLTRGLVQLGPLLPQARQGGAERHVEDRELLGQHRPTASRCSRRSGRRCRRRPRP